MGKACLFWICRFIRRPWVNGTFAGEWLNIIWTTDTVSNTYGWKEMLIGSNQTFVTNTEIMYSDYDDIVIYNQAPPNVDNQGNPFIGPLGWNGDSITSLPVRQPVEETDSPKISGMPSKGEVLLTEGFTDNSWYSRGWYDGTDSTGVVAGGYSGNALRWNWTSSATRPDGFSVVRKQLPATDEFLIEYYVKYEDGWQGSGLNWHPHLIHVMSTEDGAYQGLARSNSGLYFESWSTGSYPYSNYPVIAHQDMQRTNTSYGTMPNNLTTTSEMSSANQCNTPFSLVGASSGTCYNDGVGWYSANTWRAESVTIPADRWTKITAHIKRNSYTNGVANFDGIMRLWVDNQLAIESTSVVYAAGAYSNTQWDKVVLAPWIGDGSPVNQTMWLDELKIWSVVEGSSGTVAPPLMHPSGLAGSLMCNELFEDHKVTVLKND